MVKLLVFAILLASSPATGLLETLFSEENNCHTGCSANYAASPEHLDACKKGCDYKFHSENCPTQCKLVSENEAVQASCQVGCTLSSSNNNDILNPFIAVDPVPENKDPQTTPVIGQPEPPRSIILIRLRQRPSNEFPSMPMHPFFNSDPIQMFNDIIKQFQERANHFEQSLRKSFDENAKDLPKLPDFNTIQELPKSFPIIRIPINADSSSEENNEMHRFMKEAEHGFKHHREHMQPARNHFRQFITDVRSEWNDLVRKQPKIPIWIFLSVFLTSSAILWYMVMSLCRHTPSRNVMSIRAQELIFHPYDYEAYEKEKIQPDDQPYEVTESLPIKVKLSNI